MEGPICQGAGELGELGLPKPLWLAYGPCCAAVACDFFSMLSIGFTLCSWEVD